MEYTKRQIERIKDNAEKSVNERLFLDAFSVEKRHEILMENSVLHEQYVYCCVLNENRYLDV